MSDSSKYVCCESGHLSKFCHLIFIVKAACFIPVFLVIKRKSSFFGVAVSVIDNDVLNKVYRNNIVLSNKNVVPSF